MSKNRTNRQRAARRLAAATDLSYAAALELLRSVEVVPDLDDPAAVAELLAARNRRTGAADAPAGVTGRFEVTIDDRIGHTRDVLDAVDLWPDMADAITAAPEAPSWSGETGGSAWTVRPEWAAVLERVAEPTWADEDGNFTLRGGGSGNPGCDECGSADAVVHLEGTYLCRAAAIAHAEELTAAEAGGPHCRVCGRPAGGGHHLAGVIPEGQNPVVCDRCWDERLR